MSKFFRIGLVVIFLVVACLSFMKFYEQKYSYRPSLYNQDINNLAFGVSFFPHEIYTKLNEPNLKPQILNLVSQLTDQLLFYYENQIQNIHQVTYLLYNVDGALYPKLILEGQLQGVKMADGNISQSNQIVISSVPPKNANVAVRVLKNRLQDSINHLPNSKLAHAFMNPKHFDIASQDNFLLASLKYTNQAFYLNTYTPINYPNLPHFPKLTPNKICQAFYSTICVQGSSLAKRLQTIDPNIQTLLKNSFAFLDSQDIQQILTLLDQPYEFAYHSSGSFDLNLSHLTLPEAVPLFKKILAGFRLEVQSQVLEDGSRVQRASHTLKDPEFKNQNLAIFNLSNNLGTLSLKSESAKKLNVSFKKKNPDNTKNKFPLRAEKQFYNLADEIILINPNAIWPDFFRIYQLNIPFSLSLVSNLFDDGLQTIIKIAW